MMKVSIPNRAICALLNEVEEYLGRKLFHGAIAKKKAEWL